MAGRMAGCREQDDAAIAEQIMLSAHLLDRLAGIEIDRKVLSDIAIHEPASFEALVGQAKKALEYLKDTTPNAFEGAVKS